MSHTLHIHSYAKLNYTLDVLSPRPDGFHNLATVMQTISLADSLRLEVTEAAGVSIFCEAPGAPADESNLAYRAAAALLEESGSRTGVRITLQKRIPSQAGLGGGSSNAAYTLLGLNRLLDLGLSDERLASVAAALGSDVPFFLVGGTASARGRGEVLSPLPDGPPLWFVVVKPDVNVSTGQAYSALDAKTDRVSNRGTRRMEEVLAEGDAERVTARMSNDFEQVVCARHPSIALALDDLLMARARNARLCGSGAAVFGVAYSQREAEEIARLMRLKYAEVHVCRALGRAEALRLEGEAA